MNKYNQRAAENLMILFGTIIHIAIVMGILLLWRMSDRSFLKTGLMIFLLFYFFTFPEQYDWSYFNTTHQYMYSFFEYFGITRQYSWYISRFLMAMMAYTSLKFPIYIAWALFAGIFGMDFKSFFLSMDKTIGYINNTDYSNYGLLCISMNIFAVCVALYLSVRGKKIDPISGLLRFIRMLKENRKNIKNFSYIKTIFKESFLSQKISQLENNFNYVKKLYRRNPSKAGYAFEKFAVDLMNASGMKAKLAMTEKKEGNYPPVLMKSKGDGGIDILCHREHVVYAVQAKLRLGNNPVKGEDVSKTYSASLLFREYYKKQNRKYRVIPVLLTTGQLDNTARAYAEKFNVQVWNTHIIKRLIGIAKNEEKPVKVKNQSSFFYDLLNWSFQFRMG